MHQNLVPLILFANCKSRVNIVTRFAWIAKKLESSNNDIKYAYAAYWNANKA